MIYTSPSQPILPLLLLEGSHLTRTLLRMLTHRDILHLSTLSRGIKNSLASNTELQNWMFYNWRLAVEKSYSVDMEAYGFNVEEYVQRVLTLCWSNQLVFGGQMRALAGNERHIQEILNTLVPEEQSREIVAQVRRCFMDPEPARPVMRRKTVGEGCKSSIQVKMATEGCDHQDGPFLGEEDEALKGKVIVRAEEILGAFHDSAVQNLILQLRYRGQLVNELQESHWFLKLVQLILLETKLYIISIQAYLNSLKGSLTSIEFLQEYLYRYAIFRNTLIELDEKFNYFFETFEHAFHQYLQNFPRRPKFSLWRIAVKQWLNEMKGYHQGLNGAASNIFIQAVEAEIETKIAGDIANEEQPCEFNVKYQLEKFKAPKSVIVSLSKLGLETMCTLLQEHTEYAVDVSCNAYSVHWLGSSELRLGRCYSQLEACLSTRSSDYLHHINSSFTNDFVKVRLAEFFVEASRTILKPNSATKVETFFKSALEELVQKAQQSEEFNENLAGWKFDGCEWEKEDQRVRQMNYHRRIKQETAEGQISYFSLEEQVSLEKVRELSASGVFKEETAIDD